MLQIDPLSETAQQRLMQLHLRQGEASSAIRLYRQFESLLRLELNLSPSHDTRELFHEALRQQRSPVAFTATPERISQPPHLLPFIGREHLLDQLSSISQEAQAGRGVTVLLQGEGGIGKSRLLEEFTARLNTEKPPWLVLQGACSPFDDLVPYGPFLEAFQNGAPGYLNDQPTGPDAGLPDARDRFSWRVLQAIRSLTLSAPLLLAMEDLQWANSSTLNLFGLLSMRLPAQPALLVGTVQHAEAIPALQRLITLGRRRGELHLLTLPPLPQKAIAALLHASGAATTSLETLAEWLHARSAGNPFLLTEILAQLRAETILQPAGDSWQFDATHWLRWRTTFSLPETTHDLVAWRLANLTPDAHHILDILAVAGQPLPIEVLREFPGIQPDTFLSLVDDLASRGLLIEPPGALLALPHHLLRETLLQRQSNLRRRTIHQQLSQALEAHFSSNTEAQSRQIALHAVAGEDIDRARLYGLHVLADLLQEYSGAETVDFVHHLYDLLAPSASAGEMSMLTHALGILHQALGQLEIAAFWQQKNLEWARQSGDPAAQAEAHFERSELALTTNDYQAAAQAARDGLAQITAGDRGVSSLSGTQQLLIGRGYRLLGAAFAMEGSDLVAAEDHLQKAVTAHRQTGNQGDLCAALFELGNISAQRGELQRALAYYEEAARAAEAGRIHYYLALAHNNYAYHSLLLGRVDKAQESAAQGMKVAETYDLLAALLHLYSTRGEIYLYLGEWEAAEESFQHGLSLAEDLGSLERQAGYRGGLALAARGRGDSESAGRLLEEALALIDGQGYWHLRTRLQLWLAETLLEQARYTEAGQIIEMAITIAGEHHRTLLLVQGERLRARLLAATGDWNTAQALFVKTLEDASSLGLPLEIARVQAAWGLAARQQAAHSRSPIPEESAALLADARTTLSAHNALAELAALRAV
jgi:tetratricopeptide (TPR) repeat protein